MIDIVMKNVQQIGTPTEEDRIYISNKAYEKVHNENHFQRAVYVMMGHTQSNGTKYATFIEDAIEVEEIQFQNNVPIWNNKVWSEVFKEIKEKFDDSIIVGWAVEINGLFPTEPAELERIHKEQFGGRHQLLFLMNSQEREEYFFTNKRNRMCKTEGFFVYYKKDKEKVESPNLEITIPKEIVNNNRKGCYRDIIKENNSCRIQEKTKPATAVFMVGIVAMLVIAIGLKVYEMGGFDTVKKASKKYLQTAGDSIEVEEYDEIMTAEEETETEVAPVKIIEIQE